MLFETFDHISQLLGTLAGNTSLLNSSSKIDGSRESGVYIAHMEYTWSFSAKTADEGPILWGLALGEWTIAEIDTALLEFDPQNKSPTAMGPQVPRLIWLGTLAFPNASSGGGQQELNQPSGKSIKWTLPEGQDLQYWFHNAASGALTTGTIVKIEAKFLQRWLND